MTHQLMQHTLPPFFSADSRVLLLGSFPSPKSRELGFYYGHPQNRFWPVMASLWDEPVPLTTPQRQDFARRHRIALWDVISQCSIRGADDASIRDVCPNDLNLILSAADIREIFVCGHKAFDLYNRFCLPVYGRSAVPLPSTSPANCRFYDLPRLKEAFSAVRLAADPVTGES